MIIDMHVHSRWETPQDRPYDNLRVLIECAKRHRIDKLIVLGNATWPRRECSIEVVKDCNDTTLMTMADYPDMCLGCCFLDPAHPVAFMQVETERCIVEGGMVGIKLHTQLNVRDKRINWLMERAAELAVPIVQHSWYKSARSHPNESNPADVADLARRFPQVTIVMCHLTGCGARGVQNIKPYPNIYVDTSGGQPETVTTEYAVQQLGVERVLYGSDATGRDYAVQLARIYGADISVADKEKILGSNARRVFKLS